MNLYAAASLLGFIAATVLGMAVIVRDGASSTNRAFFLLSALLSCSLLVEFGMWSAETPERAHFFWRLDVTWPFIYPALLHFVLIYTQWNRRFTRPVLYSVLYAPAAALFLVELLTDWITPPPIPLPWGYGYDPSKWGPLGLTAVTWNCTLSITALVLAVRHHRRATTQWRRRQSRLIALGLAVPIACGLLTEMILPNLGLLTAPLGKPSFVLGSGFIAWAIWRYHAFQLAPRHVADSILTTMSDACLLADVNQDIIAANRAAVALFAYPQHELIGLSAGALFADDAAAHLVDPADADTPRGAFETTARTLTGAEVPVSVSWGVLETGTGVVYIARDITQRKAAEAQLLAYQTRLEELVETRTRQLEATNQQLRQAQKMEALGQLAGGVAHDFNNLLMGILGNLALAKEERDDEELQTSLNEAERAGLRAAELVRKLLAFSRAPQTARAPTDAAAVINEVAGIVRQTFDRSIELVFAPNADLPAVLADAGQLHQVLLNLCVNARDAIEARPPEDGAQRRIRIEAVPVAISPDDVPAQAGLAPGDYVRLSVADTGVGMDADTQQRVFEPFFTTKEPGRGTGLGLASVYGIVQQHNGWVGLESVEGAGSTFYVYMPVAKGAAPTKPSAAAAPVPIGGQGTVLIIDDEQLILNVAAAILKKLGYDARAASSGPEGLEVYGQAGGEIDAVLLDLSMPGMSGYEVLKQLRAVDPEVRVVISSGYAAPGLTKSVKELGAAAFIAKPYDIGSLAQTLDEVLRGG